MGSLHVPHLTQAKHGAAEHSLRCSAFSNGDRDCAPRAHITSVLTALKPVTACGHREPPGSCWLQAGAPQLGLVTHTPHPSQQPTARCRAQEHTSSPAPIFEKGTSKESCLGSLPAPCSAGTSLPFPLLSSDSQPSLTLHNPPGRHLVKRKQVRDCSLRATLFRSG